MDSQKTNLKKQLANSHKYTSYDKELGWSIKKNGESGGFRANAEGIRADKEYDLNTSPDVVRIATFGDSFTHNDEVDNNQTWQRFIEKKDDKFEVINFGVGGFGIDQAFLRYLQEGKKYNSHIVLIGFMQENYFRHVNSYRPFYAPKTGIPFSKPRFVIRDYKLTLIDNPIRDVKDYKRLLEEDKDYVQYLCKYDHYCQDYPYSGRWDGVASIRLIKLLKQQYFRKQPKLLQGSMYNMDSEAYRVTKYLIDSFYQKVKEDGAIPIIVNFPDTLIFKLHLKEGKKRYEDLLNHWKKENHNYIDLTDHFLADSRIDEVSEIFAENGHYNAYGNTYVADYIIEGVKRYLDGF